MDNYTQDITALPEAESLSSNGYVYGENDKKVFRISIQNFIQAISPTSPIVKRGDFTPNTNTLGALGQMLICSDINKAYICVSAEQRGPNVTYNWKEIPSGELVLSIIENKVDKLTTIAGLPLSSNISAQQLKEKLDLNSDSEITLNIDTGLNHTTSDEHILSEKAIVDNFARVIKAHIVPASNTKGKFGTILHNSLAQRVFLCLGGDEGDYIWVEIPMSDALSDCFEKSNIDTVPNNPESDVHVLSEAAMLKLFVQKSLSIAGLSLDKDISVSQLVDALGIENRETENYSQKIRKEFVIGKNIFNSEMEFGQLNNTSGQETASDTLIRSAFIEIEENTQFILSYLTDLTLSTVKYFFYDENKNFLSYVTGRGVKNTPENTAYVRLVLGVVESLSEISNIQIEYGAVATDYEPYKLQLPIENVKGLRKELDELENRPVDISLNSVGEKQLARNIQTQIADLSKVLSKEKTENGYYNSSTKKFVENNSYGTNYYTVEEGMSYNVSTFVYFSSTVASGLAYLDTDGNVLNCELIGIQAGTDERYVSDYRTTAPKSAVTLAVTYRLGAAVSYAVVRELQPSNIISEIKLNEGLNTHKSEVSGVRQRRPLVSFLDDDGDSICYTKIFNLMKEKNVPFDIAFEGSEAPYDLMVGENRQSYGFMRYDQLQEMIDYRDPDSQYDCKNPYEGAEVVAHMGHALTDYTGQDLVDYVESTYYNLTKRGIYPKGLAYAYGYSNEEVRDVVSRYYKYGVRTGSNKAICNSGVVANYYLHRVAMYGYYSSKAGVYDASLVGQKTFQGKDFPYYFTNETVLTWLKSCVDETIYKTGWLIFMTHSKDVKIGEYDTIFTDLDGIPVDHEYIIRELIDYIKEQSVDIVKMDYAFEIFGNAIECGDYLGVHNNDIDANHTTPGIAITKEGKTDGILMTSDVMSEHTDKSGVVYDATYINSIVGNIESLMANLYDGGGAV